MDLTLVVTSSCIRHKEGPINFGSGEEIYTLASKMGLVADIQGGCYEKGTSCIRWYPNSGQNQKWRYENGTIKSTMNNLVMDIAGEVQEKQCLFIPGR